MLDDVHIERLEQKLGVTLPRFYRAWIKNRNGGSLRFKDETWTIHPIFDDTDRTTARRTASHIGAETAYVRDYPTFPREGVAIAGSEERARLLLLPCELKRAGRNHLLLGSRS